MSPDLIINVIVVVSLVILMIAALLFVPCAWPLLDQARRTLTAYERLANTLDAEVPATLGEFKQLAQRVNVLGSEYSQRVTDVGHRVEEMSGSLGVAAEHAKKESSIWGSALLAGVKAYLTGKPDQELPTLGTSDGRQLQDRGEQNVRQ